jgi:hypothetical protein
MTCVFLACKMECAMHENHMQLDEFLKGFPNVQKDAILGLEFRVCKAQNFKFMVHLPYLPLCGLFVHSQKASSFCLFL